MVVPVFLAFFKIDPLVSLASIQAFLFKKSKSHHLCTYRTGNVGYSSSTRLCVPGRQTSCEHLGIHHWHSDGNAAKMHHVYFSICTIPSKLLRFETAPRLHLHTDHLRTFTLTFLSCARRWSLAYVCAGEVLPLAQVESESTTRSV